LEKKSKDRRSQGITPKTDIEHPFYDRLKKYLDRLKKSTKGEQVLVSTSLIETILEELIRKRLPVPKASKALFEGAYAPIATLSAKIDLAYGLGIIFEKEQKDLHALRKIRNLVAHEFDFDFESDKAKRVIQTMSCGLEALDKLPIGHAGRVDEYQQRFQMIMTSLVLNLYGRETFMSTIERSAIPAAIPMLEELRKLRNELSDGPPRV